MKWIKASERPKVAETRHIMRSSVDPRICWYEWWDNSAFRKKEWEEHAAKNYEWLDETPTPESQWPTEMEIDEAYWEWFIKEEMINGGISGVLTWEQAIEWLKGRLKTSDGTREAELLNLLNELVAGEEKIYKDAKDSADYFNNNTDNVGITIPYATYPALPQWIAKAKSLLNKTDL